MTLSEFSAIVNELARNNADTTNRAGTLFKAQHVEYPKAMLSYYHGRGMTPTEAAEEIAGNAGL